MPFALSYARPTQTRCPRRYRFHFLTASPTYTRCRKQTAEAPCTIVVLFESCKLAAILQTPLLLLTTQGLCWEARITQLRTGSDPSYIMVKMFRAIEPHQLSRSIFRSPYAIPGKMHTIHAFPAPENWQSENSDNGHASVLAC